MRAVDDVLIVGGGVIGLACALALREAGRDVTVLDAGSAGCGSSHGNCGTITPSHALPLAAPGTIARAARWMLSPDAPLYVRPRFDPSLWAWLARLAVRCNHAAAMRSAMAKMHLLEASRQALPDWIARHHLDCEFQPSGTMHVFRDARALDAFAGTLRMLAEVGVASEAIAATELLQREPALREGVAGAVRFPGDASLRPDRYVAELARALRDAGGTVVEQCAVESIESRRNALQVRTSLGTRGASDVLVAAGAWSPRLARALSPALNPLGRAMQPGKGYSITYDRPTLAPRMPLVLHERSVCVTTWEHGYRLGSTMEFSGYDATLNRRRVEALERGAREYLHEPIGLVKREEWFGWRPMTFDDVPIIGRVPGPAPLWLATGHGMLGVSMSVATAELVAELVTGRAPRLDPAPYRIERFG